ncbi:MAG TPA: penicillin-binding protein 2 [Candidatus Omnitrophica bacterium]|nr:MAG: penicillin-binding protein 2 [Candidatus Omnitrophota bacterium]RKY34803.1 MAG: penicillin-binding protein 2 [Candidatus Omnitrophota bacterium]RKY44908.1 MAG: penicillin-binding protein 2 [Candidatus Omnitrophota bacterium]HEC68813.1 penicillin-binding protein 2 [Candidatus Omnitrophota bacterium]
MVLFLKRVKIIGFSLIVGGLIYYQLIKGDYFFNKSTSNYIRLIPQPALRGLILDRKGKVLVKNSLEFEVCVFLKKPDVNLLEKLGRLLGTSSEVLEKNFKRNFIASFIPTPVFQTADRERILKLEEKNLPQVSIRLNPKRYVKPSYSISHIVGFVRKISKKDIFLKKYGYDFREEIGYAGLELFYDNYLRGKPGGLQIEIDARGRINRILGKKKPTSGKTLSLSLDIDIQNIAYQSLKGFRGSLVLMESSSGKILAMASRPSFNVNLFRESRDYFNRITKSRDRVLINRAIQGVYPLGSVFKTVVGLAGLEERKISKNSKFLCEGVFKFKDREFKCWTSHGWQDIVGGFLHSCNIFFYNTGLRLGSKIIEKYAYLLGLGRPTGIDLPFEKEGFVPSPEKIKRLGKQWYPGDTLNLSIGQGYLLATPLQVAVVLNFFASRGWLIQPYLVEKIGDLNISLKKREFLGLNLANIELINKGLREAVRNKEGTAHILEDLNLEIAGKTGTAQVRGRKSHAWFAGFFPYKEPKYVIVVILENAGSSTNACKVAYNFLSQLKEKKLL